MALTDQLVAYWKFEEASGTRIDEISGLTLTDNNTCPQVTGKSGNGVGFTSASSEYLSDTDANLYSIDTGESGFSVIFWAYPTVDNQSGGMASKGFLNGGNHLEWQILQGSSNNNVQWQVSYDGAAVITVISDDAMTKDAWNFVACRYRSSDGSLFCRVGCGDDGVETLTPNTPHLDTGDFNIGRYFNNMAGYWQGRIDEFSIYQRFVTDDELDLLCPGTLFYPFAPTNTYVWSFAG